MNEEKRDFLKNDLVSLLKEIPSDRPPAWGKMTLQQMIEHLSDYVRIASGKTVVTKIYTPEENLQKMRDFMMSDKPFRENTPNPLMPEVPAPVKNPSVSHAIAELQNEISFFFSVFEENNMQTTRNLFFGDLNYEENVQLLYKHVIHHLRQFGIVV